MELTALLSQAIIDTFVNDNSWRNYYCIQCGQSHKRSIVLDGFDKWEDQHTEDCVVQKAREYLKENV